LRPMDAAAQADLARTLAAQGQVVEASERYRRAVALAPGEACAHVALGNALLGEGAVADAPASYRRALAIRPDLAEAHMRQFDGTRSPGVPARFGSDDLCLR